MQTRAASNKMKNKHLFEEKVNEASCFSFQVPIFRLSLPAGVLLSSPSFLNPFERCPPRPLCWRDKNSRPAVTSHSSGYAKLIFHLHLWHISVQLPWTIIQPCSLPVCGGSRNISSKDTSTTNFLMRHQSVSRRTKIFIWRRWSPQVELGISPFIPFPSEKI